MVCLSYKAPLTPEQRCFARGMLSSLSTTLDVCSLSLTSNVFRGSSAINTFLSEFARFNKKRLFTGFHLFITVSSAPLLSLDNRLSFYPEERTSSIRSLFTAGSTLVRFML